FEILHLLLPTLILSPGVLPDMKLKQIYRRKAQVCQALFGVEADVISWKNLGERVAAPGGPTAIAGRNLGRHVQLFSGVRAHKVPQKPLALSVAVGPGGVEEVTSQVGGELERLARLIVVGPGPADHAPH